LKTKTAFSIKKLWF